MVWCTQWDYSVFLHIKCTPFGPRAHQMHTILAATPKMAMAILQSDSSEVLLCRFFTGYWLLATGYWLLYLPLLLFRTSSGGHMIEAPAAAVEASQSPPPRSSLSPASPEEAAENLLALRVGGEAMDSAPVSPHAWLWEGYLAQGDITLLTSQWKSGKTTLVSVLLAKMAAGGELAGLRVHPGRAAASSMMIRSMPL
jgi:hypothetical protein